MVNANMSMIKIDIKKYNEIINDIIAVFDYHIASDRSILHKSKDVILTDCGKTYVEIFEKNGKAVFDIHNIVELFRSDIIYPPSDIYYKDSERRYLVYCSQCVKFSDYLDVMEKIAENDNSSKIDNGELYYFRKRFLALIAIKRLRKLLEDIAKKYF